MINSYNNRNLKYVFLDLWGTIFLELENSSLNDKRAEILFEKTKMFSKKKWREILDFEILNFKKEELSGYSVKSIERIKKMCSIYGINLTQEQAKEILNQFDIIAYNFLNIKVNFTLLENIPKQLKKILVSNTGLITSECTVQLLKKHGIYEMFDKIYLSEKMGICKPNIDFFKLIMFENNIKTKDILFIGDSVEMDYIPCKKLNIECVIKKWSNL